MLEISCGHLAGSQRQFFALRGSLCGVPFDNCCNRQPSRQWNTYNLGHQGAIVLGLRKLAGIIDDNDIVVTMDSDGEDSPEDIPSLVAPLLKTPTNAFMVSLA